MRVIITVLHRRAWTCWGFALPQSGLRRKESFMDQLLPSGLNRMLTSPLSLGSPLSATEWVDDGAVCKEEDVSSDGQWRLDEHDRLAAKSASCCLTSDCTDVAAPLLSSPLQQVFLWAESASILCRRYRFQKCPTVSSTAHSDSRQILAA